MTDFFVCKPRSEVALYDFMSEVKNGIESVTSAIFNLFAKLPLWDLPSSENPATVKPMTGKPMTVNPMQINTKEVIIKELNTN